jgi:tetratricopeptide (TPR) repeat protein
VFASHVRAFLFKLIQTGHGVQPIHTLQEVHFMLSIRHIVSLSAATTLILLAGCGQGRYTKEHTNAAKVKMNMLKSATEYQMAYQAFMAGDLDKAASHVDYSLSLSETVTKSHVLKGRVMMEKGDLEKASACFQQAQTLDEKSVEAAYYQGVLAERVARKDEALKFYEKAAELEPANAQYSIAAAEMLIDLSRIDEADAFLRARLDRFVNNAGVKQVMGNIAMLRGDTVAAQALYSEARLLDPENKAVVENLIRAQMANNDVADAEVNLSKLLNEREMNGRRDLRHMRARCLVQLDRPVEARDLYLALTKDSEGAADAEAWKGLGEVAFVLKDTQRVKLCAQRLIAIAPQSPDGWVLRGLLNRRTGDLQAARMNLEQALHLRRDSNTLILLGMVQQELNMTEAARESYRQALLVQPENADAKTLLSTVPEQ